MDAQNGYAVICNARAGQSLGVEILALVDRTRCKSLWWTSDDLSIAIRYASESAARFAAKRLKHNKARVVPFSRAVSILHEQANEIMHKQAESDSEEGWDAHKTESRQ